MCVCVCAGGGGAFLLQQCLHNSLHAPISIALNSSSYVCAVNVILCEGGIEKVGGRWVNRKEEAALLSACYGVCQSVFDAQIAGSQRSLSYGGCLHAERKCSFALLQLYWAFAVLTVAKKKKNLVCISKRGRKKLQPKQMGPGRCRHKKR